jgi:hypothetical protein
MSEEEYDEWALKEIQQRFTSKTYTEDIEKHPTRQTQLPAFYFDKRVQNFYAEQFVKSNEVIEDYAETDIEKNELKTWKLIKYNIDSQMMMRQEYDTARKTIIDNTSEMVPIFEIMKIKKVMEIGKKSKKWRCKNHTRYTIDDISYGKGDIIKLKNDVFVYFDDNEYEIPDERPHNKWTTYKITRLCNDSHSSELLNPYFDIREMDERGKKFVSREVWIVSAPHLSNKIKMLQQKKVVKAPNYSENDYVEIYSKKYPLNELDKRWNVGRQKHYVKIVRVETANGKYGIQFMSPFDKNKLWGRVPENDAYIHTVDIVKFDAYTKKLLDDSNKWSKLEKYATELPFMIYEVSGISRHVPSDVTSHEELLSSRNGKYRSEWEKGTHGERLNGRIKVKTIDAMIHKKPSSLKLRKLKRVLQEYWKEVKAPSNQKTRKRKHDKYDLSHIDDVKLVLKKAKYFWKEIRWKTLGNITKDKKPFTKPIADDPDGFQIGDEFWIFDDDQTAKLGYISYYFKDNKGQLVYGIFFSSDPIAEKAQGDNVSEYTKSELVKWIKEDKNPMTFLNRMNDTYHGAYTEMIERFKRLM